MKDSMQARREVIAPEAAEEGARDGTPRYLEAEGWLYREKEGTRARCCTCRVAARG